VKELAEHMEDENLIDAVLQKQEEDTEISVQEMVKKGGLTMPVSEFE
jgi:hypothetical protein